MSRHRFLGSALGTALLLLSLDGASAQAIHRPQPTCIQNVTLRGGEEGAKVNLLLRDGRIEAVQPMDAPIPRGMRLVEGDGLIAVPGFVDAYTRTGCPMPEANPDQDMPVDTGSDVRVDMRLANRKGIQPAFRAAEALAIEAKDSEGWRSSGFGAALVSPGGELLSGSGALVTTREAAMRDVVAIPDVFACGEFSATGGRSYPSTLMGFIAQLRQFFLDTRRHAELLERQAAGRPGERPPFDADLEAGLELLEGERTLLCKADSHRDIERWIALADQFGLEIAISGGRDAWRVADVLAERDIPVLLTLDWGEEVDDPTAKDKKKGKGKKKEKESEEGVPEEAEDAPKEAEAKETGPEEGEPAVAEEEEIDWEYSEPLELRKERRRLWEETRDCALRLHEAGVRIAFGTDGDKPKDLLERVRDLVEAGLPEDVAFAGLTTSAAQILGTSRLGELAPGFDATLSLWNANPLTYAKAQVVWNFVDGFPTEFEPPKEDAKQGDGEGPAEGIDVTGSWSLVTETDEGSRESQLTLEMSEDGSVTATLEQENPMDGSQIESELTGSVSGKTLTLSGALEMGEFSIDISFELEIDGDTLSGDVTLTIPGMPEPMVRSVEGQRDPA